MKIINDNTTNTACAPLELGLYCFVSFTGRCPALMLSGLRPDYHFQIQLSTINGQLFLGRFAP
ncbi:MAG: hypothetical protein LBP63_01180 [Prevotellaceae bacterium]|nr:hypothetical protein [Prevotellaceae bacterium]